MGADALQADLQERLATEEAARDQEDAARRAEAAAARGEGEHEKPIRLKRERPAALRAVPASAGRGGARVTARPRPHRPATRRARSRLLPHDGVFLFLVVLAAIGAGVALLMGLLDITVAP